MTAIPANWQGVKACLHVANTSGPDFVIPDSAQAKWEALGAESQHLLLRMAATATPPARQQLYRVWIGVSFDAGPSDDDRLRDSEIQLLCASTASGRHVPR